MFITNETAESNVDNNNPTFDNIYISSDNDDDDKFLLESLDLLLKKKKDDLWLQMVSQFLHLFQDQGYIKINASNLLAQSLNKGLW